MSEEELQKRCAAWLRQTFSWAAATATMNGTCLGNDAKSRAIFGSKAKQSGVSRGVPDWLFFDLGPDDRPLAIELKVKYSNGRKGRVRPEQVQWLQVLRQLGWR